MQKFLVKILEKILENVKLDNLGKAGRIIVSKDSTIIVDDFGNR